MHGRLRQQAHRFRHYQMRVSIVTGFRDGALQPVVPVILSTSRSVSCMDVSANDLDDVFLDEVWDVPSRTHTRIDSLVLNENRLTTDGVLSLNRRFAEFHHVSHAVVLGNSPNSKCRGRLARCPDTVPNCEVHRWTHLERSQRSQRSCQQEGLAPVVD